MTFPILSTILDQASLSSVKYGIVSHKMIAKIIGFILGGAAYYSMGHTIELNGVATSNANWNVLSTLFGLIIGAGVWGETILFKQVVGMVFGIISLYLIDGI